MPKIVVVGGAIVCPHQGRLILTSGSASCDVSGAQVVTSGLEAGLSFAGPPASPPCSYSTAAGPSPCAATSAATTGVSLVLTIGGAGALTEAASGPVANPSLPGIVWTVADPGQSDFEVSG